MTRLAITFETPHNTEAWTATLYFDDGDFPNAGVEGLGYWTTADEAIAAMHAALAEKPDDVPGKDGNTAGWSGLVEHGYFERQEDDEWFAEPSFERVEREDYTAHIYRHDMAAAK